MAFVGKGVFTNNALRKYGPFAIPLAAFFVGSYLNKYFGENYRTYHNRSALYGGRDLKPGERLW
jgi:hypothetical protein